MEDDTEEIRRVLQSAVNAVPDERALLEKEYGQVWTTQELGQDFEVKGFMAPFVEVKRKSDGVVGSLMFQHMPRFYFSFTPD